MPWVIIAIVNAIVVVDVIAMILDVLFNQASILYLHVKEVIMVDREWLQGFLVMVTPFRVALATLTISIIHFHRSI